MAPTGRCEEAAMALKKCIKELKHLNDAYDYMEQQKRRDPFSKAKIILLGCAGDGMKPDSYRTRHTLRNAVEEITVFEPVQEILVQAVFTDTKGKKSRTYEYHNI